MKFYRCILILTLITGIVGTAGSFFSQYVLGFNPCPLCILQRISVIGIAIAAAIALLMPTRFILWRWISSILISLPALAGLGIAIRQIILQQSPPSLVAQCGPGLNFMIETLPLSEVLSKVLLGTGDCSKIERIWGIPLPMWGAALFLTVLMMIWFAFFKTRHNHPFGY